MYLCTIKEYFLNKVFISKSNKVERSLVSLLVSKKINNKNNDIFICIETQKYKFDCTFKVN